MQRTSNPSNTYILLGECPLCDVSGLTSPFQHKILLFDSCGCIIGAMPRNLNSDEKNSKWTMGGVVMSVYAKGETGMVRLTVRWASGPDSIEVVSVSSHLQATNLSSGDARTTLCIDGL